MTDELFRARNWRVCMSPTCGRLTPAPVEGITLPPCVSCGAETAPASDRQARLAAAGVRAVTAGRRREFQR